MRVLVTGATGFVGRHVAAALANDHQVYGISRGGAVAAGVTSIVGDLALPLNTLDWPVVDAVVHLAQSSYYASFPTGAADVFAIATGATQALLEYAVRIKARRFVFASTGGLYAPSGRAIREEDPTEVAPGPIAHYLACKRAGEIIAVAYAHLISVSTPRIFFCYGPGQAASMLIARLARSVFEGRSIRLQGADGLRLNPIFVTDAAVVIGGLVTSDASGIFNLAGPRVITLREIAEILGQELGRTPVFDVATDGSPASLVADISRLVQMFGPPPTDPREGLASVAASLRDSL